MKTNSTSTAAAAAAAGTAAGGAASCLSPRCHYYSSLRMVKSTSKAHIRYCTYWKSCFCHMWESTRVPYVFLWKFFGRGGRGSQKTNRCWYWIVPSDGRKGGQRCLVCCGVVVLCFLWYRTILCFEEGKILCLCWTLSIVDQFQISRHCQRAHTPSLLSLSQRNVNNDHVIVCQRYEANNLPMMASSGF
jgi:hypothetical protein